MHIEYSHNFMGFRKKACVINIKCHLIFIASSSCIRDRDSREKPTARHERGLVANSPGRRHRHNRIFISYVASPNYNNVNKKALIYHKLNYSSLFL